MESEEFGKLYMLDFGEHRNKTPEWVWKRDPLYCAWMINDSRFTRPGAKKFVDWMKQQVKTFIKIRYDIQPIVLNWTIDIDPNFVSNLPQIATFMDKNELRQLKESLNLPQNIIIIEHPNPFPVEIRILTNSNIDEIKEQLYAIIPDLKIYTQSTKTKIIKSYDNQHVNPENLNINDFLKSIIPTRSSDLI